MPKIELTIENLLEAYDWASVFGEENAGNCDADVEAVGECSKARFTRADVAEVIAAAVVEGDYAETSCWGLFRLKDGRYLAACGWCDTTGWDCQAGNNLTVANTLEEAIQFGIDDEGCRELGIERQPESRV